MPERLPALLRFAEHYVERPWGGRRLEAHFGKPLPAGVPIGEAWLVSDHPQHESVVAEGPLAGLSLRALMQRAHGALLGPAARTAPGGRFPLLLKLIDAAAPLSVQVHPDDATAAALGEPDGGKSEQWHILDAAPGAHLYCGLRPGIGIDAVFEHAAHGRIADDLAVLPARPGDAIEVPAGTVHAIGAGILLAEIQQNSDLTYRLYDWGRTGPDGQPRALHLDKARAAIEGARRTPPEAHFDAARLEVATSIALPPPGVCQILLALEGPLEIEAGPEHATLAPGQALVIPAAAGPARAHGPGALLRYTPAESLGHAT